MKRLPIDPDLLRDRLAPAQGKTYWRSLEELAQHPAVLEMLQREFPDRAGELTDPVSRRRFLALMGASLALAGLSGCARPPAGVIMPYVHQPEELTPGKPLYYATTLTLNGFGTGVLVESHEGRPTKIEGNPQHPAGRGATSAQHQASILDLYDPDRARGVTFRGQPQTWSGLQDELRRRLRRTDGKGLAVLSESIGSPTLARARSAFLSAWPRASWHYYEPINRDSAVEGTQLAFGSAYHSYAKPEKAGVIVAIDDFLSTGPGHLAYARGFGSKRREG